MKKRMELDKSLIGQSACWIIDIKPDCPNIIFFLTHNPETVKLHKRITFFGYENLSEDILDKEAYSEIRKKKYIDTIIGILQENNKYIITTDCREISFTASDLKLDIF